MQRNPHLALTYKVFIANKPQNPSEEENAVYYRTLLEAYADFFRVEAQPACYYLDSTDVPKETRENKHLWQYEDYEEEDEEDSTTDLDSYGDAATETDTDTDGDNREQAIKFSNEPVRTKFFGIDRGDIYHYAEARKIISDAKCAWDAFDKSSDVETKITTLLTCYEKCIVRVDEDFHFGPGELDEQSSNMEKWYDFADWTVSRF